MFPTQSRLIIFIIFLFTLLLFLTSAYLVFAQGRGEIVLLKGKSFTINTPGLGKILEVKPNGQVWIRDNLTLGGRRTYLSGFDETGIHWLMTGARSPVLGFKKGSADLMTRKDLILGDKLVFNSQDNDWALFDEATSDFDSSGSQENKLDLRLYLLDDLDDSQKFSIWGGSCAGPDGDITTPADNNCADPLASTKQHEFTADGKAWIRDSLKVGNLVEIGDATTSPQTGALKVGDEIFWRGEEIDSTGSICDSSGRCDYLLYKRSSRQCP